MAPRTDAAPAKVPSLEVRRTIRAPQQRVYDAWTTPEELKRWHAPGPLNVSHAELDLRVGGSYRIHMQSPDGKEHRVTGTYREVDPPRKLVYSWSWEESGHLTGESTVTLEFIARGDATEVVLTHAIADDKERASHAEGWNAILDKMVASFS